MTSTAEQAPLAKPVEAASFTPGPWLIQGTQKKTEIGGFSVVGPHLESCTAYVASQADAALIAAAPDLLAALEAMKDALAECENWTLDQQIAYGKAHSAIVKARS